MDIEIKSIPPPVETLHDLLNTMEEPTSSSAMDALHTFGYSVVFGDMNMLEQLDDYEDWMEHMSGQLDEVVPAVGNNRMIEEDVIDPPCPITGTFEEHQAIIDALNTKEISKYNLGKFSEYGLDMRVRYEMDDHINPHIHILVPKEGNNDPYVWLNIQNIDNSQFYVPRFRMSEFPLECSRYMLDCVQSDKLRYTEYLPSATNSIVRSYWIQTSLKSTHLIRFMLNACKNVTTYAEPVRVFMKDAMFEFQDDLINALKGTPLLYLVEKVWLQC